MDKMNLGIELGTNKSCLGYEYTDEINIIPNFIGEKKEPSIVSIINDKAISGESAYLDDMANYDNTITEIKRLIALNFINNDKILEDYKKHICYKIEKNENNNLVINIKEKKYTLEEILSYLIKQIIENGKNNSIIIKKSIVFAVPSCFGIQERILIKKAAMLANIIENKISMINETTAAALAYELYINQNKFNLKYNYKIFKIDQNKITNDNRASGPTLSSSFNALVIDIGASCFNLSIFQILEIKDNEKKKFKLKVKANLGTPFLGGIDFDNLIMNYCIKEYCESYKINEKEIFNNKKAIKTLKLRCEIAKKILSEEESVIIYIKNFLENIDLCVTLTRQNFENICDNLFKEIRNKINRIINIVNIEREEIKDILLIGGSCKIPKILEIIKNIFNHNNVNIIENIDTDKIVVTGAALYAEEKGKETNKFFINEAVISSLGINIINKDINSFIKYGDKMLKFIKKNSYFPLLQEFEFKTKITNKNKISINIYEGECNYVKFNRIIGNITFNEFEESMINQQIKINIVFELDSNYILRVRVTIPECSELKEIALGLFEKKDLSKLNAKLITKEVNSELIEIKKNIKEYSNNVKRSEEERYKTLKNCCKFCENIIKENEDFYKNEYGIMKIYEFSKDLLICYSDILKIKNKSINENEKIIEKIKEGMRKFVKIQGYNEILKKLFKDISEIDKNIYYSIILDYIELILSESIDILKENNQSQQNSFKIYFEFCSKIIEDYSNEMEIYKLNIELIKRIKIYQKINAFTKYFLDYSVVNKDFSEIQMIKNEVENLIQEKKYLSLNSSKIMIDDLEKIISKNNL